ncbi:LTA synthase family protein [Opitutus terrae]|uniref:LTA synthase family protein n=1 Tax=Opitutus terrae TaxID=107709 RepID=UPI001ED954C4|nr:LTA synthase family protein [Opitutus terrae]
MKVLSLVKSALARRDGGVLLFVVLFVSVSWLTRLALGLKAWSAVSLDSSLLAAAAWALAYDLGAALLWSLPLVVVLVLLPRRFFTSWWGRSAAHLGFFVGLYALLFGGVAEWFFWDEFGVRFNFIAVDYLVYTKEVIGNIRESYPLPWVFAGLGGATLAGYWLWLRAGLMNRWLAAEPERFRWRLARGGAWIVATIAVAVTLNSEQMPGFANNYNRELAKNGLWSLFAAFRNNELDYDQFYPTLPVDEAFQRVRTELAADRSDPLGDDARDTLRFVRGEGAELHPNVIQITVESLSAEFLGRYHQGSTLTPNLDALAARSLVFDNLYATGTRTDRGMEALTLSLPPTPGRSLIKRPHNEHLFTLGSVFRSRGYDTAFLYGGYGYFDNMNYFFGHNGYRVVDRASVAGNDITFANAWGACDEDLYRWTLREADAAHAAGKPFHFFVMTTSNHRPYTYPEGRIDLPSKISGRAGAVKYTDFAIGQFLRDAESKPWFRNTVFVVVADHCASVAGRTTLPVQNYHIPMLIYAPGGQVAPGHVTELMSQVDFAPTLLGLLRWSYASRFFGWDVRTATGDRRALIGNYQKLGLYETGMLSVVMPVRAAEEYSYDATTFALTPRRAEFTPEAIAYYQTASYLFRHRRYRELSPEEQAHLLREAQHARPPSATVAVH